MPSSPIQQTGVLQSLHALIAACVIVVPGPSMSELTVAMGVDQIVAVRSDPFDAGVIDFQPAVLQVDGRPAFAGRASESQVGDFSKMGIAHYTLPPQRFNETRRVRNSRWAKFRGTSMSVSVPSSNASTSRVMDLTWDRTLPAPASSATLSSESCMTLEYGRSRNAGTCVPAKCPSGDFAGLAAIRPSKNRIALEDHAEPRVRRNSRWVTTVSLALPSAFGTMLCRSCFGS